MKKTDKKVDNALRKALTVACDIAEERFDGFLWLTHRVDYQRFPDTLLIVCVFNRNDKLRSFLNAEQDAEFCALIGDKLADRSIAIKGIEQHVRFDSEENCKNEHNGNWQVRIQSCF